MHLCVQDGETQGSRALAIAIDVWRHGAWQPAVEADGACYELEVWPAKGAGRFKDKIHAFNGDVILSTDQAFVQCFHEVTLVPASDGEGPIAHPRMCAVSAASHT